MRAETDPVKAGPGFCLHLSAVDALLKYRIAVSQKSCAWMTLRTFPALLFLSIFIFLLIVQFGVHSIANDVLVVLLPGDGCGQILNYQLQNLVRAALWVAYVIAFFSAFSFARVTAYGRRSSVFVLSALAGVTAFLVGGTTHLIYREHLTFCDVFFMGQDAAFLNFAVAGLLLLLTIAVFWKTASTKERRRNP